MEFLFYYNVPVDSELVMKIASKNGHLGIVEFLYNNMPEFKFFNSIFYEASIHDHIHIVKWAVEEVKLSIDDKQV